MAVVEERRASSLQWAQTWITYSTSLREVHQHDGPSIILSCYLRGQHLVTPSDRLQWAIAIDPLTAKLPITLMTKNGLI